MSSFTEQWSLEPIAGRKWQLLRDLAWAVGKEGSGVVYTVRSGLIADLATIPGIVRWWLNPADARFAKAAIIHDCMLDDLEWSRWTAAAEFREALKAGGVSSIKATIMGLAVLGWTAWLDVKGRRKN